jgi:tetratricopeptide (TPR) repeat protein/transcriptional regulator with XRE-family HTH domain
VLEGREGSFYPELFDFGIIGGYMSELHQGSFGSLLRSLRTTAGLTQEELAEAARVSYRSISDLERGVSRFPRRDTARLLADALDLAGDDRARFEAAARGRPLATGNVVHGPLPGGSVPATRALPRDIASFTGREPEIESVLTAVTGAGPGGVVDICAIDGMAGVGKTALAVHAAHRLADRFPDGQIFLQLHGHTPGHQPVDPADALASLLQACGIPARSIPDELEPRAWLWRDRLAGRRMLLVLDNAASTGQVVPLLPGDGECLVLITSRRHLGDLPGAVTSVLLDVLTPAQAAEMFTRLAPRAADRRDEVAEVVRLAGFLPLAISLLARLFARHQSWTLSDLAAETAASLLTLTAEQESVTAAFEVSYRHLDPALQRFFCLLGLHPGTSFEVHAAAALAGTSLNEAAGLLDTLHREGLLTETGHRRYGMHDLLRRYARNRGPVSSGEGTVERLLDYYQRAAALAQARLDRQTRPGPSAPTPVPAADPAMADVRQALEWARAERDNLLACLDHVTRTGQHARIIALTASLAELLQRDGPWIEAIIRHTAAARSARHLGDRLGQANALNDLGAVRLRTGDYPGASGDFEQALVIYDDLGDRLGQANALLCLGIVRRLTGDYKAAAGDLERVLATYRDIGDELGQANALVDLGTVLWLTGDPPAAVRDFEQALAIYGDLGYQFGHAYALTYLGIVRQHEGDYPGASGDFEQALAIYRDYGDRLGQAGALTYLASVRQQTGNYRVAAGDLEQALAIFRDIGDPSGEAKTLNEIGTLRQSSGRPADAQACHQQALELARAIASAWDEAHALAGLGRCAIATGNATQAETFLRQAHDIFERIGAAEVPDVLAELNALVDPGTGD